MNMIKQKKESEDSFKQEIIENPINLIWLVMKKKRRMRNNLIITIFDRKKIEFIEHK